MSCLGPLTFHCQAVGDRISLSQGGRLAKRKDTTFKNGLVFSSRPLRVRERILLRVERDSHRWHGALRVGFTCVDPACSLPLPPMAIPNLTNSSGYWAAPVDQAYCNIGSELEFWVSSKGTLYFARSNSSIEHKLLSGVDISMPLWAIIDVYGQTSSILLQGQLTDHTTLCCLWYRLIFLFVSTVFHTQWQCPEVVGMTIRNYLTPLLFNAGSEKRGMFLTMRSCPAPECLTSLDVGHHGLSPNTDSDECISCLDMEVSAGRNLNLQYISSQRGGSCHQLLCLPCFDHRYRR